jgi:type IV secretion system protein TrbL
VNVLGWLGSLLGGFSFDAFFGAMATWVGTAASWLLGQLGHALESSTAPGLSTPWFAANEHAVVALAGLVVLPMAVAGVLQAVWHQSASMMLRSFLVKLPLALVMSSVAVELVRLGITVTDQASSALAHAGGVGSGRFLDPIASLVLGTIAPTGVPSFLAFVAGLFVVVASFVIWLELAVRAAAIEVATLFLPLVLAALVWPAVSHWVRRLADTIAALVLSKLVVVAVLSLGASALAAGARVASADFASAVSGVALLLLAAFAPFSLLRLVPAIEAGAVSHLEAARHQLVAAASGPVRLGARVAALAIGVEAGGGPAGGIEPGVGPMPGGPDDPPPPWAPEALGLWSGRPFAMLPGWDHAQWEELDAPTRLGHAATPGAAAASLSARETALAAGPILAHGVGQAARSLSDAPDAPTSGRRDPGWAAGGAA